MCTTAAHLLGICRLRKSAAGVYALQIRAERAPSMPIEELQEHSVNIIQHLHHGADHPVPDEVHDPSQSPAIKDNMEKSKNKTDQHNPL